MEGVQDSVGSWEGRDSDMDGSVCMRGEREDEVMELREQVSYGD